PMRLFITFILLLTLHPSFAQKPFDDDSTLHIRTILNGKATMLLPDDYSYSHPFWAHDEQFTDAALYQTAEKKASFACNLFRKLSNSAEVYRSTTATKHV